MAAKRTDDPATAYARAVCDGREPAATLLRLACERHLRDLARLTTRGYTFRHADVDAAVRFFAQLRHSKGEWAGQSFTLAPFQAFIAGSLLAWKQPDGRRRFRNAYVELPRKNGKSTFAAGLGIRLAFFDQEPGAEVFCVATKRDQARIVWSEAQRMVQRTPGLTRRIQAGVSNLHHAASASKLEPLGADADTLDGLNIHGAIGDELHAWKGPHLLDVVNTATAARRQPLVFLITTAGFDRASVCWHRHDYSARVLEQQFEDDGWFAFMAGIDEEDDWTDPVSWRKANPALGVSVKVEDLTAKCARAQRLPVEENAFRRLHLCQWTQQNDRWLPLPEWDACRTLTDVGRLEGEPCFGGLDLANTTDIASLVLLFPRGDRFAVLPIFWVPEDGIERRASVDGVPYDVWARAGLLRVTPGAAVNYRQIVSDIHELAERFQIQAIGYDPWNAEAVRQQLEADGLVMVKIAQTFSGLAEPTKRMGELVLSHQLEHDGHAVLRWMASNMVVRQEPGGAVRPDKARAAERIDGIVAAIIALGVALRKPETAVSVYESRGVITLDV